MSPEIKITEAEQAERTLLVELLSTEKLPTTDLPEKVHNFFTAKDGNTIVGVIGLELYGSLGLLRSLAVSKAYRNRQIGLSLVKKLEAVARQQRLSELYLLTETAPDYFQKLSYSVVDRSDVPELIKASSEFSNVCPTSAMVLKKSIL